MPSPDPPPVPYEPPPAGVSRRAYRRLLVLTLLNTAVLAAYVVGPVSWRLGRQQWAAVQQWRATRRAAAARAPLLAAQQRCLDYTASADQLVYAESAADVARLGPATRPAGSGAYAGDIHLGPAQNLPVHAVAAVAVADPPAVAAVPWLLASDKDDRGIVYLHARQAGVGRPVRLVAVTVWDERFVRESDPVDEPTRSTINLGLLSDRWLTGRVVVPGTADADGHEAADVPASLKMADRVPAIVTETTPTRDGKRAGPSVDRPAGPAGRLRLYAGQSDPADPAAFHIRYQFDPPAGGPTRSGTIAGRLAVNDTVSLTPDSQLADLLDSTSGPNDDRRPSFAVPSPRPAGP